MKATELMIGDWVHVEAHRGFNAQNVKVETIPDNDGDNEYGHHYGHIGAWLEGGDNDFRDVEVRHLQLIPLTAEILEKNGFTRFGTDYILEGEHFGLDNPSNPNNYLDNYWLRISKKAVHIEYIHELQHALRLCGIEKEIEL